MIWRKKEAVVSWLPCPSGSCHASSGNSLQRQGSPILCEAQSYAMFPKNKTELLNNTQRQSHDVFQNKELQKLSCVLSQGKSISADMTEAWDRGLSVEANNQRDPWWRQRQRWEEGQKDQSWLHHLLPEAGNVGSLSNVDKARDQPVRVQNLQWGSLLVTLFSLLRTVLNFQPLELCKINAYCFNPLNV